MRFGQDAHTDWEIVFFAFLALNLFAIGVSVFMYGKINKGELFLVDKKETVSVKTLNRLELEKTVSFFADKQGRFDALKRKPPLTSDPFVPGIKPKEK